MTTSKLPARPSLESLRKQAKKLARDIAAGDAAAIARARAQLPQAELRLSQRDAQLVLAREYGFPGWKDLLKEVKQRLGRGLEWAVSEARHIIHDNDIDGLRQLLTEYPALLSWKADENDGGLLGIATGSFGAAGGLGGVSALVNTQFQYLDVGVNIDITPRVHAEGEVTLKMTLEVSSVSGTQNIGGISQPVIGQRRIEHETRLRDGEVNLVGGILEDTESNSLSGYPWLTRIPILKYLFGQEAKDRRENEIIFAITPHIIRAQEVTDDNLRLVDLGRGSSVSVGHTDPRDGATSKGLMDQSAANKGQGRTQGQRTTVPATAPNRSVEVPKAPAQMPVPTATTTPVRPATASIQQSNPAVPAAASPANTPPPRPVAQAEISPPPRASLQAENFAMRPQPHEEDIPPVHPASQAQSSPAAASADKTTVRAVKRPAAATASTEQCPTGTHLVGTENGVINCSFD